MISQVLNREFVLDQLRGLAKYIENTSSDPSARNTFFRNHSGFDVKDIQANLKLIKDAVARETALSSGQRGFGPATTKRTPKRGTDLDDLSFFSRDPIVSIVQSVLEEYLDAHEKEHRSTSGNQ